MTRKEFKEKRFHELVGMVVDGAVAQRTGAELSVWIRMIQHRINNALDQMYDDLIPPGPIKAPKQEKA